MQGSSGGSGSQSANPQTNPVAYNQQIRRLIVHGSHAAGIPPALDMIQALNPAVPANAGPGTVITVQMRNVGLVKRLLIELTGTLTAGNTSTQTLVGQGLANLVSNVTFTDFANNLRVSTTGWHLVLISSVRRGRVFGAAYTSDNPFLYGNVNTRTQYAPATINANGTSPFRLFLEVPLSYSDDDLRGAVWGDVTQATAQLQITLNSGMFVSSTGDPTLAMYQSAGSDLMTLSAVACQIYQNYLDDLPVQNGVTLVPPLDVGTGYLLTNVASSTLVQTQDNAQPFVNARQFQSVAFIYDNNGTNNINGADINSIKLQSANLTQIINVDPFTMNLFSRMKIQDDFPKGTYYMDFRKRPVDTNQYGNMQWVVNPSSVLGIGSVLLIGYEAFGIIGLVNQGGAIPSGA